MFEKEFANLFRSFEELREIQKETDKKLAEENAKIKVQMTETDRQFKETDRQFKETDRKIAQWIEEQKKETKNLKEMLGGIGNSQGEHAEDFFWSALSNKPEIAGIAIDEAGKNVKIKDENRKTKDQFDIVLTNCESIIIVEVKYKVKFEHIQEMRDRKIPNFKKYHKGAEKYIIYGGIAGFCFDDDMLEKTQEAGLIGFKQMGDSLIVYQDNLQKF